MKLAVASGKGGTGKTTVATNLCVALAKAGRGVAYLDCDVEEPNGHIFLQPTIERAIGVELPFPQVDLTRCTFCGECAQVCEFRALAVVAGNVLVFHDLCHSCGACYLLCPERAISEVPLRIGTVTVGRSDGVKFAAGELNVGVARPTAVSKATKQNAAGSGITIIDAPPGTSCAAVEAVKGSDFVLLVTEPTPFGLSDLKLAVAMLCELKLPHAVLLNRADVGDDGVQAYCRSREIEILIEIPEDRAIAEVYSRGEMLITAKPEYVGRFLELYEMIERRVSHAKRGGS